MYIYIYIYVSLFVAVARDGTLQELGPDVRPAKRLRSAPPELPELPGLGEAGSSLNWGILLVGSVYSYKVVYYMYIYIYIYIHLHEVGLGVRTWMFV